MCCRVCAGLGYKTYVAACKGSCGIILGLFYALIQWDPAWGEGDIMGKRHAEVVNLKLLTLNGRKHIGQHGGLQGFHQCEMVHVVQVAELS